MITYFITGFILAILSIPLTYWIASKYFPKLGADHDEVSEALFVALVISTLFFTLVWIIALPLYILSVLIVIVMAIRAKKEEELKNG